MIDLTIGDNTQQILKGHLEDTERLLRRACSVESGREGDANIVLLPDLGMPYNVARICGGFFTGAFYSWESDVPIIPIDATVNSCGVSIYRLNRDVRIEEFRARIKAARSKASESSYVWNFDKGNHFIICGTGSINQLGTGWFAVLHSSAGEFKSQHNGLYPTRDNWYYHHIKTINSEIPGRYLRYLSGKSAEQFWDVASQLERFNKTRHRYFAEVLFGSGLIDEEVYNVQHYGMPTPHTISIGCQWIPSGGKWVLLTSRGEPIYVVAPNNGGSNRTMIDDKVYGLYPHGLGMEAIGPAPMCFVERGIYFNGTLRVPGDSLEYGVDVQVRRSISERQSTTQQLADVVLSRMGGQIAGRIDPRCWHDAETDDATAGQAVV
jgi:hypothetical protein